MNRIRPSIIALALLGALVPRLSAQQGMIMFDSPRRAWLGFSYERTETRRPGESTLTLNVVSVVDESPAAQAGLKKGDAILRINNLGASEQLLQSLGSSMNPGDTVTFHIRRDGREQDLRLIAAKPPADYADRIMIRVRPDSIRRLVQIFTDSIRHNLDTAVFRFVAGDSVLRLRSDSMLHWYGVHADSLNLHADSLARYFYRVQRDSLFPRLDSIRAFTFQSRNGAGLDSLRVRLRRDSTFFFGPAEGSIVFSGNYPGEFAVQSLMVGMRAVAGAELQELNAELARYFHVDRGLLVVNAAGGSPARRAGLEAGDVITAVNGQQVTTITELRRAIERARGETVKLEVVREGNRRTLDLSR